MNFYNADFRESCQSVLNRARRNAGLVGNPCVRRLKFFRFIIGSDFCQREINGECAGNGFFRVKGFADFSQRDFVLPAKRSGFNGTQIIHNSPKCICRAIPQPGDAGRGGDSVRAGE